MGWGYCLINIPSVHLGIIKNRENMVFKNLFAAKVKSTGTFLSYYNENPSKVLKRALALGFDSSNILLVEKPFKVVSK